ncbi:MAG: MFS transporter, partial [Pseudomonadota bacterium]
VPTLYLGLVYLVFAPSIFTTPLAGQAVQRFGPGTTLRGSLGVALCGLLLTVSPSLPLVLLGLAILGAATFFAQAAATGFVSGHVVTDQAAANGLYLTSYYVGGLAGALLLGQVNMVLAWPGVCGVIAGSMLLAIFVARSLEPQARN